VNAQKDGGNESGPIPNVLDNDELELLKDFAVKAAVVAGNPNPDDVFNALINSIKFESLKIYSRAWRGLAALGVFDGRRGRGIRKRR
jgi:hypothetical protein